MIRIGWFIPLTVALMLPACGSAHHDYDDPVEWDGDSDESTVEWTVNGSVEGTGSILART